MLTALHLGLHIWSHFLISFIQAYLDARGFGLRRRPVAQMKAEIKRFLMETSDINEACIAAELSCDKVKTLIYEFLKSWCVV